MLSILDGDFLPDPDFNEKMYIVATMIAAYTNKHVHFDLMGIDEMEQDAGIRLWKEVMQDMIEERG